MECPHCGHSQAEPRTGFSTICKKCGRNFRVQEALNPRAQSRRSRAREKTHHLLRVRRGTGGAGQRAVHHVQAVQPLHGPERLPHRQRRLQEFQDEGFVHASNRRVTSSTRRPWWATPSSRAGFSGKLVAEGSLTIHTTAEIKGSFTAGRLIIPAANQFRWREPIKVGSAEIAGELAGGPAREGHHHAQVHGPVVRRPGGRRPGGGGGRGGGGPCAHRDEGGLMAA